MEAYGEPEISERHRHRYEVNNAFIEQLESAGMQMTGRFTQGDLVEIVELPQHPWFLGCQFHPEFKSRPMAAHPLFTQFITAALANAKRRTWSARKQQKEEPAKVTTQKARARKKS